MEQSGEPFVYKEIFSNAAEGIVLLYSHVNKTLVVKIDVTKSQALAKKILDETILKSGEIRDDLDISLVF